MPRPDLTHRWCHYGRKIETILVNYLGYRLTLYCHDCQMATGETLYGTYLFVLLRVFFLRKKPKRPYDVKTFSIVWKSQLLEFCAHRQACNKVNCDQFQHFRPPSLSFDGSFVHWTIYCKIPAAEIDPRGCFPLLFTLDPSLPFLFTKLNVVLD